MINLKNVTAKKLFRSYAVQMLVTIDIWYLDKNSKKQMDFSEN